jgi:hypothetical protein
MRPLASTMKSSSTDIGPSRFNYFLNLAFEGAVCQVIDILFESLEDSERCSHMDQSSKDADID